MRRAFTLLEVLAVVAILGLGAWWKFPSLFSAETRRAASSTTATAKLEDATFAKGAEVAASVATIGQANAEAPSSPSSTFIAREVPFALSLLPPPDAKALIEAAQRKTAITEGKLELATKLYENAAAKADRLVKERDEALNARQAVDLALEQAAAASHAKDAQMVGLGIVAFLAFAAFAYVKIYHISPATIGEALADIGTGVKPIDAFSSALAPRQHAAVRAARKLAAPDTP